MYKEIFSAIAIALTFIAYIPYIHSILKNKIKPHVFSWVIWGSTTIIVFFAQYEDGGGAGSWPIGVSGVITFYVAFLAYIRKSDITIVRSDWYFFLTAMASIPFWYFASDPLWAVIILTTVDIIGFGPTARKAYKFPFEEQLTFFALFIARNIMAILALEHYSLTTVLFPFAVAVACLLLIIMIMLRRRNIA